MTIPSDGAPSTTQLLPIQCTMQIKFKQLLLTTALALTGAVLPLAPMGSNAQANDQANDQGGCFMVDEAGNTISLGSLCGYGSASSASPSGQTAAANHRANGPEAIASNGVVQVPIVRRAGRTPVIAVNFNDSQTYEMILDTGASGTLITRRMADDLNLRQNGEITASIADGSRVRFPTSRVRTIAVDAARVSDVDVAIADDMTIGLLGHDFFGNYDIRIGKDVVEFSPQR